MSFIGKVPANAALTASDLADGIVSTDKLAANAVITSKITDGTIATADIANINVTQGKITDQAINEAKMQISNSPTNGYFLSAQSGNTGGLTWTAAPSAEAGIPYWRAYKQGNQTLSNNTNTEITFNHDEDPYSGFASNKFIVPSGKGGLYLLGASLMYSTNTTAGSVRFAIRVGDSGNPGAGTVEVGMSHGGTYTSTVGSGLRTLTEGNHVSLYVYNATGADLVAYGTTGTVTFWGTRIK